MEAAREICFNNALFQEVIFASALRMAARSFNSLAVFFGLGILRTAERKRMTINLRKSQEKGSTPMAKMRESLESKLFAILVLGLAPAGIQAAKITVPSGSILTIQQAVDTAAPGDTISVLPGTYGAVTVNPTKPGLMLKAAGPPGSVKMVGSGYAGFAIQADNVSVGGFEISQFAYGIVVWPSQGVKITGNRIGNLTDKYARAVFMWTCTDGEVGNNTVFGVVTSGIELASCASVRVHDNQASNVGGVGISLSGGSTSCEVDHNTVSGCGVFGVFLNGSAVGSDLGNHIHHNQVDNNGWGVNNGWGIMAWQSPGCQFDHNELSTNALFGIYLASSPNCTATHNTANGNGSMGILLDSGGSANCTISFNEADGNGLCGVGVGAFASYGTTFDHNSAHGNGQWDFVVLWATNPPFNYTCIDNSGTTAYPSLSQWGIK